MATGSPAKREPYGDGVPVVAAGPTTGQEGRESRNKGEGAQVVDEFSKGRHAHCGPLKRRWASGKAPESRAPSRRPLHSAGGDGRPTSTRTHGVPSPTQQPHLRR